GVIALKEPECCALVGTDYRPLLFRRRAGRPQLKRDPLGRASQASARVARCAVRTRDRAMTKMLQWYLRLLAGLTIISWLGQLWLPSQLGAARFYEAGGFGPWRATDIVHHPCAGGRVARSLSAIR